MHDSSFRFCDDHPEPVVSGTPIIHISKSRSLVIYHPCVLIRERDAWSGFHQSWGRRGLTPTLPAPPACVTP